jgi:hypothetical protein
MEQLFHVAVLVLFFHTGSPQPAIDRLTSEKTWKTLAACEKELPAMKKDFRNTLAKKLKETKSSLRVGFKANCEPVNSGTIENDGVLKGPGQEI